MAGNNQKHVSETPVVREILAAFGSRPDLFLWRNNVGVAVSPDGKRVMRFGTPGAADIVGVWRRTLDVRTVVNPNGFQPLERLTRRIVGQAIAIEVKRPASKGRRAGKQSEKQETWQAAFEAAGGLYILAYSVEDVEDALGARG